MLKQLIAVLAVVFLLGWLSHTFYADLALARADPIIPETHALPEPQPSITKTVEQVADAAPVSLIAPEPAGRERPSPTDRLKPENIHVTSNRVVIDAPSGYQFETAIFTNTNSMDNFLDEESQALQFRPKSERDLKEGDTISYDPPDEPGMPDGIIIHRIIRIGYDEQGWYAIVKGDNNTSPDPIKVRFPMIRRVLVGVLY